MFIVFLSCLLLFRRWCQLIVNLSIYLCIIFCSNCTVILLVVMLNFVPVDFFMLWGRLIPNKEGIVRFGLTSTIFLGNVHFNMTKNIGCRHKSKVNPDG